MKKEIKSLNLGLFFMFAVIMGIFFVQAGIQTSDSVGKISRVFSAPDEIYIRSDQGLCNQAFNNVELYIVESGKKDTLVDIRENPQEINLTQNFAISNTRIWSSSEPGEYEIVVDCDKDGKYHLLEPLADFRVTGKKGNASAITGENNIGNHSWQYDSEEPDLINEMLQITLLVQGEDIKLKNMTIEEFGSYREIDKLGVYLDENNDGKLDENELQIGDSQPAYTKNRITLPLSYNLTKDVEESFLIVYTMKTTSKGNYSLEIESIYGEGIESLSSIKFSGLPIKSGTKTVAPEKKCLGTLNLKLEPNPADENSKVSAKITNLTGCENESITLRTDSCDILIGEEISSCKSEDSGCEISFTALESKEYYACIDKNNDGDIDDSGESAFEDLDVVIKEVKETSEKTGEIETGVETGISETEKETKKTPGIIGRVIGENLSSGTAIFLVVLELTLLLIFIVLVVISIRLKKPVEKEE